VNPALVLAERARRDPLVELVGIEQPLPERLLERRAERALRGTLRRRSWTNSEPPAGTSRT
jgi:hypothetical protein